MENILNYATEINKIETNPYFQILDKLPTLESFLRSQQSFVTAIDFWSKILASLLIHMPSDKERSILMKNLWDEHGCGNPAKSHVETFREFMRTLGYQDSLKIEYLKADRAVFNFVQGLNSLQSVQLEPQDYGDKSKRRQLIYAVSALGMIEFTYVTISKCIHGYASHFAPPETIPHYATHQTLDVSHATELFSLVEENWDDEFQEAVKDGVRKGYDLMFNLYQDLSVFLRLN